MKAELARGGAAGRERERDVLIRFAEEQTLLSEQKWEEKKKLGAMQEVALLSFLQGQSGCILPPGTEFQPDASDVNNSGHGSMQDFLDWEISPAASSC